MAVRLRPGGDGTREVSMEEFKKILMNFDGNHDGRIDVNELREAIRAYGGRWFCTLQAHHIVKKVDSNHNGAIDDDEMIKLAVFAMKQFGCKIVKL